MFLHVCVCPPGQVPPGRYNPWVGTVHPLGRYTPPLGRYTPLWSSACWEIWATSSQYASYWNAFLCVLSDVVPGALGPMSPFDPRFWGPKIEHFWALLNFSIICFASLCLVYYFFNMLLFQSSSSKIFRPRFTWHMISHIEVFVFSLSFTHFRLLGVHLSLSCF